MKILTSVLRDPCDASKSKAQQTDGHTDDGQSHPYVAHCFAATTKSDWQHSEECTCRNIAMRDYQESVTTGQTDTHKNGQTPDKGIPKCTYASQATQIVAAFRRMHVSPVKHSYV